MKISQTKFGRFMRAVRDNQRRRVQKTLAALPFIILAAGVVLCVWSGIRLVQISASQKSQIAAELWSGDSGKRYRQITCFAVGQPEADGTPEQYLSSAVSLNTKEIEAIRDNLDSVVKAASGEKEASSGSSKKVIPDDGKKLWIDAYSSQATCTVVREATEIKPEASAEVTMTGVSGDYYLFHPLTLLSGAFLTDDTLDSKKIVLDQELAFKLFGYYEVAGSEVVINQRHYTVVGVVKNAGTKIDQETSGKLMHAYILFDELSYLSAGTSNPSSNMPVNAAGAKTDAAAGKTEAGAAAGDPLTPEPPDPSTLAITCYEAVLPDKIDGIAMQNLKSAMESAGKVEKNFYFVDNTNRFSLLRLYDTVFPIGEKALERQGYLFPFWELSAQTAESVSVFWWIIGISGGAAILSSGLAIYSAVHKRKEYHS